jgi:hypothetical protein
MKNQLKNSILLPLAAIMMTVTGAQGARPGGVAVLLPPFIPVPAPQPFLLPVSPFDITGFMQTATVTNSSDIFSGGTLEVNGILVTVPRNTEFQMPAAAMTWQEMFSNAPAAYKALGQSGLAMQDGSPSGSPGRPLTTYEVHVQGNRVINPATGSDQYIAGLIFMSQNSTNTGQGYINCIDYNKMEIWLSTPLQKAAPCSGTRLRINTPTGRYGKPDPLADVRFTSDEGNPTISARTGYPMCLPRIDPAVGNDSLCPTWNRPRDGFTGAFSTIFTMGAATAGLPDASGITHQVGYPAGQVVKPDPFEQAPFEVGDYITWAGSLVQDNTCVAGQPISSCQYVSAHTMSADVGIFTAPGTFPVYLSMSEFRIGVGGVPNPLFPQEAVEKIFGDTFTTDNTNIVDMYAVDVNSVTGARTHRFMMSADPFGPPLGGLKGRARFRSVIGNFLPATREMAISSRAWTKGQNPDTVAPVFVANGLQGGIFQAPQFEFIFPENLIIGSPQIPLTFDEFPFLTLGSGPYTAFNALPGALPVGNLGQLSPFPSLNAPSSVTFSLPNPPTPNAGSPQTVPSGATVTLDASASTDLPGTILIYTWQQSAGPAVTWQNINPGNPKWVFTAPTLAAGAAPVTLTFQLAVCNGFTCSGVVSTTVTVLSSTTAPSVSISSSKVTGLVNPNVVTLTANATVPGPTGPVACACTYTFAQTAGPAAVLTPLGTNQATFVVPVLPAGTPLPALMTFTATAKFGANPSATAAINVYMGTDTITIISVVYKNSKSQLKANVTDNVPNGAASITMIPLDANGNPLGPNVVMTYDPTTNSYLVLQDITNPIPNQVRFVSTFGANLVSPITRVQ